MGHEVLVIRKNWVEKSKYFRISKFFFSYQALLLNIFIFKLNLGLNLKKIHHTFNIDVSIRQINPILFFTRFQNNTV